MVEGGTDPWFAGGGGIPDRRWARVPPGAPTQVSGAQGPIAPARRPLGPLRVTIHPVVKGEPPRQPPLGLGAQPRGSGPPPPAPVPPWPREARPPGVNGGGFYGLAGGPLENQPQLDPLRV